jgi:uncharacterized membrane protein
MMLDREEEDKMKLIKIMAYATTITFMALIYFAIFATSLMLKAVGLALMGLVGYWLLLFIVKAFVK